MCVCVCVCVCVCACFEERVEIEKGIYLSDRKRDFADLQLKFLNILFPHTVCVLLWLQQAAQQLHARPGPDRVDCGMCAMDLTWRTIIITFFFFLFLVFLKENVFTYLRIWPAQDLQPPKEPKIEASYICLYLRLLFLFFVFVFVCFFLVFGFLFKKKGCLLRRSGF